MTALLIVGLKEQKELLVTECLSIWLMKTFIFFQRLYILSVIIASFFMGLA